jgi:hypothetical protein
VTDEQVRAAHGAVLEQLRRGESLATSVPTSIDVHAVMTHWNVGSSPREIRDRCARLDLALADAP